MKLPTLWRGFRHSLLEALAAWSVRLLQAMGGTRHGRYWCEAGMHWTNEPSCSEHRRL